MNRRAFLSAVAASVAGGSVLGAGVRGVAPGLPSGATPPKTAPIPPARPEGAPARTLRKAAMLGMVADDAATTTLDRFKLLKDCGFEGVEVDSPSSTPVQEYLEAQAATGIIAHGVVNSVHWRLHLNNPSTEVRARAVESLRTCLRDAQALGASSVLLVPAVVNADMAYDEAWRLSQEGIKTVLPEADERGVTIAVENVWNNFLLSPLEAARFVDDLASPRAAWHLDIGNVINFGWPEQWARMLGPRVAKLHIKDFSRTKRDKQGLWQGFDVQLGEGDAGWPRVMAALDQIGYSTDPAGRWATAEVRGGDRVRLEQVSRQMDALWRA